MPCWAGVSSVSKCVQGDNTDSSPWHLNLALALNFILFISFLVLPSVLLLRALPVVGEKGSVYRRLPSPSSPRRSVDGVAHRPVELGPDPNLFKLLDRDLVNSPNHGGNITACSLQLLAGESKASLSHDTRL